ncbi:MutS-related protein [Flavobacterium muglaense]|uniref:DNA mismatch repair protein n=1 Tax=Flavobacterium muglaense TaxID=2764716 RepID=A0A923N235_9FLAO|nr:DNA mismatch repair protein [Flavobacterium muglaense]MBC5838121.1 DNA mismatch repair protein [Flavobacterium muglaense]MBC5844655.1 DNA mismatch repair protein [Flavobacterium muglaense]
MEIYKSKVSTASADLSAINAKYNTISFLRLVSIAIGLGSLYFYIKNSDTIYIGLAVVFFAAFIVFMRLHSKLLFKRRIKEALIKINQDEISYLEDAKLPFENGLEFNDFQHPYAYDLDIFGEHSLFQNLNRTATFIGKKIVAQGLLQLSPNAVIMDNQEAIKELEGKLDWRQGFLALAKISQDTKATYESLLKWSKFGISPLPKWVNWVSYATPVLFLGCLIAYFVTFNTVFLSLLSYVFILNLIILGLFFKRIQAETANSAAIDKVISQYSLLLKKIEEEPFESKKLKQLQQKLQFESENASEHIQELSGLFSNMDTIANLVTASLFNGSFLFNLHVLKKLLKWKKQHASVLEEWLEVIGEFEMLNSLANFSYNNPDFVFPSLNTNHEIDFASLSHPLLNKKSRVGNDVQFHPQSFMILTGSNMSGKSTFLRSLGVNMVLAGLGSVVCASKANVHPLPILVSMRLSDSLSDSESYFFAEIKRLKQIMDALEQQPAFVLLDEILRGTNSDDKRNGTIEVVKKVIAKQAIGAIATHDIEVCLTTNDYPDVLTNQCFEVEIVNDDLHFDYKLRQGICKNKSATFLMTKMGVI